MGFKALDYSVSVIAIKKKEELLGMTCAWAMQVDYDKMVCLLGAQSQTGKALEVGDILGISVLNKKQKDYAIKFGEGHSKEGNKFLDIKYIQKETALLLPNSTRMMICKVEEIFHLKGIEEDSLIYVKIIEKEENGEDFLHYNDL